MSQRTASVKRKTRETKIEIDLGAVESADRTWKKTQTGRVVLFRNLKEELKSQANPQKRNSKTLENLHQTLLSQRVHGGSSRSHPGENDPFCLAHHVRISRHREVRFQILQGISHVVEIAGLVINNDDHSTPLVEGTFPPTPRSTRTAILSDRAKPLNMASIRWCSFSPAFKNLKCTLHLAAMARDLKKVRNQLRGQITNPLSLGLVVTAESKASSHIHRYRNQNLIHRKQTESVSFQPLFLSKSAIDGLPQSDS